MANFHPARTSGTTGQTGAGRRRRVPVEKQRTPDEATAQKLGARRHGCYTFVMFVLALAWITTLAGLATATNRWGWWGLLVIALPLAPSLARHRLTNKLFLFTVRNAHRSPVLDDDVDAGGQP